MLNLTGIVFISISPANRITADTMTCSFDIPHICVKHRIEKDVIEDVLHEFAILCHIVAQKTLSSGQKRFFKSVNIVRLVIIQTGHLIVFLLSY